MRGFITKDSRYYETENGKVNQSDVEVPLRPSEHHTWNDGEGWLGARQSDEVKAERMTFQFREVWGIVVVAVMIVSFYFALRGDIRELGKDVMYQGGQIAELKTAVNSTQSALNTHMYANGKDK